MLGANLGSRLYGDVSVMKNSLSHDESHIASSVTKKRSSLKMHHVFILDRDLRF